MTGTRDENLPPDLNLAVARLAALDPLDYDRVRKFEAEGLGVRVATLDDAVKRARPKTDESTSASGGRALSLPDTEPWPDPVNGATALDDVSAAFTRHLALPPGAAQGSRTRSPVPYERTWRATTWPSATISTRST